VCGFFLSHIRTTFPINLIHLGLIILKFLILQFLLRPIFSSVFGPSMLRNRTASLNVLTYGKDDERLTRQRFLLLSSLRFLNK
jgi:hypothetical protein